MDGVIYLLTGHKHACRLVVSLHSLRDWYHGPVVVLSIDPSREIDRAIAAAKHLDVTVEKIDARVHRRNGSYLCKTTLWNHSPFERTLFLDADTLIAGPLSKQLWPADTEIVLTQFSNWVSNQRPIKGRIAKWETVCPTLLKIALAHRWPAVNTGVIAWHRQTQPFLKDWQALTSKRVSFMCDELAAQLLYPTVPHRVMPERYNCSPLYRKCQAREARIWHFHGSKHLHPQAVDLWMSRFTICMQHNVANIRKWATAGDARLEAYIRSSEPHARELQAILTHSDSRSETMRENASESV